MPEYFGQQSQDSTDNVNSAGILIWGGVTFTCPGSGNRIIQELSVLAHLGTSSNGQVRLGVYDTGNVLAAEGTGLVALVGSSLSWQGHLGESTIKAAGGASPGILVGGNSYTLAVFFAQANGNPTAGAQSGGTLDNFQVADYSAGLPSTLPTPDGTTIRYAYRCGVFTPGGLMPQIWM